MSKIKVYMNDWFTNMGIVGFLNILKHAEIEHQVIKQENFIEFDSCLLENFHNYYFDYFMQEYDLAERIKKSIMFNLNYVDKNSDKIKDVCKRIKDSIKYQADKVKKFDIDSYNKLKDRFDEISKIKKYDRIDDLKKLSLECVDILKTEHINEKLTANLYKYIIGDNFFGQVSYFNVLKSSLDVNGLKQVMYNDYLLPIISYFNLMRKIQNGEMQELKKFINDILIYFDEEIKAKRLSKNSIVVIQRILKDINNKFIKKNADIECIRTYFDSLETCEICGQYKGIVSNYTESNFAPLAVSADNAMNMYWNMNMDTNICDICKLILFCTPAGATLIRKKYISNDDNEFYSFVNLDESIDELYKRNIQLKMSKDNDAPFDQLILDIVSENKEKSQFQLQNILFVEFKTSIDKKKCVMNYFDMPVYLAKFFSKEYNKLNKIKNRDIKAAAIDIILKEKDLKNLISEKLREKIKYILNSTTDGVYIYNQDIFELINIRYILNYYKKRGVETMDDKKLKSIRYAGREIHDYYVDRNDKNKIESISYRLLNTAKVRNKKDFMDILLRVFMACGKSVPIIFLDVMAEKEIDFESIAYAFIQGLISEKYEPNVEGGK